MPGSSLSRHLESGVDPGNEVGQIHNNLPPGHPIMSFKRIEFESVKRSITHDKQGVKGNKEIRNITKINNKNKRPRGLYADDFFQVFRDIIVFCGKSEAR